MVYVKPVSQIAVIPNGETKSQPLRVTGGIIVGLLTPAALTGAAFTFEGCDTPAGTYLPVYDSDGNQVSATAAASRAIGLSGSEADALAPFPYIKLVSGAAEGAERSIVLIVR